MDAGALSAAAEAEAPPGVVGADPMAAEPLSGAEEEGTGGSGTP
jgi:hypothetical protein